MKRFLPLGVLALIIMLIYAFDIHTYLSFDSLKEHRTFLQQFVQEQFALAIVMFFFTYVIVVALSLPGAGIMSITSGFLFGTLLGTAVAMSAATVGATLIFLIAKTALGESLQKKAGPWLEKMRGGFQENAFNYLLTLRLVPIFPFFIINLVPAFLGVKLRDYVLATALGVIPGGFVYVSVGTGIGSIFDSGEEFSMGSVVTPEILIALLGLALLSFVPVIMRFFKKRSS